MSKVVVFVLLMVVLLIGGGWYFWTMKSSSVSTVKENTLVQPTSSSTPVVSSGEVKSFTVEGSNFKFLPSEIRVKKGDTVTVTFKNSGGFHDFVIDEFAVQTNQIKDGEEEEVQFVADRAGTFEYYCSVGQHRSMGMKGMLIVE